jgi:hypothetical protein
VDVLREGDLASKGKRGQGEGEGEGPRANAKTTAQAWPPGEQQQQQGQQGGEGGGLDVQLELAPLDAGAGALRRERAEQHGLPFSGAAASAKHTQRSGGGGQLRVIVNLPLEFCCRSLGVAGGWY